jgi:hypothetical protein
MAIPEYQRTIVRQVQQADTASAQVWETLANTLDNFGQQAGALSRNIMANEKAEAAAQKKADDLVKKNYLDSMEADIIEAAHQASVNNPTDYEAYITEFDAKAEVWLNAKELESMTGAKQLLNTMIENKRVEYGKKPYEATQLKIKEDGIALAERNIKTDMDSAIHSTNDYIGQFSNITVDVESDPEALKQMEEVKQEALNQYSKLQAKIEDYVVINGVEVEKALEFEKKMQDKYVTGVIQNQIAHDIAEGKGSDSLEEFYENPTKFLRSRDYLSALVPEGIVISEELKESIYGELYKYLGNVQSQQEKIEKKEEETLKAEQSQNFAAYKSGIQTGADISLSELEEAWQNEVIDDPQYNNLVDYIVNETYYEEDQETLWNLHQEMISTSTSLAQKTQSISEALTDNLISGETAGQFLTKANSSSKVTSSPYFSQANGNIAKAFGLIESGDFVASFGDTGLSKDDITNMRYAQEELYRRVERGESAIEIQNEIIEKYTSLDTAQKLPLGKIGNHDWADAYTMENGFNTYFVGTPNKPLGGETTLKIGTDLASGVITETQAELLTKQLKKYIKDLQEENYN